MGARDGLGDRVGLYSGERRPSDGPDTGKGVRVGCIPGIGIGIGTVPTPGGGNAGAKKEGRGEGVRDRDRVEKDRERERERERGGAPTIIPG